MIKLIGEYIKYTLNAKQRHRIHSPFVYDFGDKCLHLPIDKEKLKRFKQLQSKLLNDSTVIEVDDLGAGSKRLSSQRKIKNIVKVSGSNEKYAKLLHKMVMHYPVKSILELGTSMGLGTYMLVSGKSDVNVVTVEGCKNTLAAAKENFPEEEMDKVTFVHSSFIDYLQSIENESFDLVFIDGDHRSESLFEQLALLEPFIHDETLIILDDIRWTQDMLMGWKELIKDERFHLSIDLFKMGILVPRKHQQKEHFIIRY